MSNSSLICCTILSPNHSGKRTHAIDTITIHCMAGNLSVESCGALFARTSRQASSNYGIGSDGRIGLYVDEENRSWCTSSKANDQRAITIEVANNSGAPNWSVSEKAYQALINLVADICKRNDIKKLLWLGDKSVIGQVTKQNMTVHRWFANKACPGNYLYERHGEIAERVNALLGVAEPKPEEKPIEKPVEKPEVETPGIKKGDIVAIADNATYYNGKKMPAWVKAKKWIVREVVGDRAVIDKSADGRSSICSPVNVKYLTADKPYYPDQGDVVNFVGKKHYTSANADKGKTCKPGKARVTSVYKLGESKHPYHVVAVDGGGSNVYGWVDADTITKL